MIVANDFVSEMSDCRKTDQFDKACTILMKNSMGNSGHRLELLGTQDGLSYEPNDNNCGLPPLGLPSKPEMTISLLSIEHFCFPPSCLCI